MDHLTKEPVLVCGLGSMGQACLERLLLFDVELRCLDRVPPTWRDPDLEKRLAPHLMLGDMRLAHVLKQVGAEQARAVLLLSSESTVNVEAALQVRLLNPTAEIVVRSSGQQARHGALLEQRLPGVAVVDPLLLTAGAITAVLRPGGLAASFATDSQTFSLFEGPLEDRRFQRLVRLPDPSQERQESVTPPHNPIWISPQSILTRPGVVEVRAFRGVRWCGRLRATLRRGISWIRRRPPMQLASAMVLVLMLLVGIPLFSQAGGWKQGVFVTLSLLKGEYADPVNVVLSTVNGLQGVSGLWIGGTLFYSLIGTLVTSALVAFILERLLEDRLGYTAPKVLSQGVAPILLVEGGTLALQVARSLQGDKQRVVRVQASVEARPTKDAIIYKRLEEALAALETTTVSAVGLLTEDLLTNLQDSLELQQLWPSARMAILAHDFGAAERLGALLGGIAVISTVDLVADALVATAFGERVEGVLRLRGVNLLLVRYRLSHADTLCGRNIARVENGFEVTAVSLLRHRLGKAICLPPPDLILNTGDQLVIMASLSSLRRIEQGNPIAPRWRLRLQIPANASAERRFEVQQCMARWIGCPPGEVAHLLDGGDHRSPPLDRDIIDLLSEDLKRQGVRCSLEPLVGPS